MADNPTIKTIKVNNVDYDIKDAKARADIAALIGSSDATSTIDTFNEVVDFLAGVTNTETLSGKLSTLETGKVSSVDWDTSGTNGKITYKKSSSGSATDVVEVESSATSGSKKPISSGAMYTALSNKADKSATVSTVTYDSTSKKIQKTINGTTTDVVTLATVATSGSYNDLSNKPTIPTVPTNVSSFTNDSGYQTSANVNAALADVYDGYDSTTETISFTFPTTT